MNNAAPVLFLGKLFVFGAVVLDIVSIAVTSSLSSARGTAGEVVFWMFLLGVVLVTFLAAAALRNGAKGCAAFHHALESMYISAGVAEHFPSEGMATGLTRYRLYFALVSLLGAIAVAVPLVLRLSPPLS